MITVSDIQRKRAIEAFERMSVPDWDIVGECVKTSVASHLHGVHEGQDRRFYGSQSMDENFIRDIQAILPVLYLLSNLSSADFHSLIIEIQKRRGDIFEAPSKRNKGAGSKSGKDVFLKVHHPLMGREE